MGTEHSTAALKGTLIRDQRKEELSKAKLFIPIGPQKLKTNKLYVICSYWIQEQVLEVTGPSP